MDLQEFRTWLQADEPEVTLLECPAGQIAVVCRAKPEEGRCNEDSIAVFPLSGDHACLVVADGMGGAAQGEVAARIVVESIGRHLTEQDALQEGGASLESRRHAVLAGIEAANREVLALGVGAGTTVVAAVVSPEEFGFLHAGDSMGVVVGQKGRIKMQTMAHSPVGHAMEAGIVDGESAMFHPERHVVSNMIGMELLRIEWCVPQTFNTKDTLVLGTDGLFDNLSTPEIVELIRTGPLDTSAADLAALARQRMEHPNEGDPSKPDDMAFLLFRPGPAA